MHSPGNKIENRALNLPGAKTTKRYGYTLKKNTLTSGGGKGGTSGATCLWRANTGGNWEEEHGSGLSGGDMEKGPKSRQPYLI